MDKSKLTPMMKQYMAIKETAMDCILFYRLGDFYEMFFDDAIKASQALEITLTARNCGLEEKAPLCGVPYHAAEGYLTKLVQQGFKVAICEQVEDPATAKGIVKREIVRIITPGTIYDQNMLSDQSNNYILSLVETEKGIGLSYSDISTGEFRSTSFKESEPLVSIFNELQKIGPKEVLLKSDNHEIIDYFNDQDILITEQSPTVFKEESCTDVLKRTYRVYNVESLGFELGTAQLLSAGSLMAYIQETSKVSVDHIKPVEFYTFNEYMILDKFTRRNLELIETMRTKDKKGSLLWVLDKTNTAMGARALKKWVEEPLLSKELIESRLSTVELLYDEIILRSELRTYLKSIYDLERLVTKLVYGNVNARDLIMLKNSMIVLPDIKALLKGLEDGQFPKLYNHLDELTDIHDLIENCIVDEPPISIKEGKIIKNSYDEGVDELRDIIKNGKNWIVQLEAREKEATDIKSLKIGFNKVFGYYLDVTKANSHLVPEHYIRKQTLANSERYITEELKDLESKVLGAEEKITKLEYDLFLQLKEKLYDNIKRIQKTAEVISSLDALVSLAEVAYNYGFVRPTLNDKQVIEIQNGRHPVVERIVNDELFVPNDTYMDTEEHQFYIITGPNMAGKSTYLRQVALITLMAQIGSFVPADSANISIVDRIFTRVGASDDLSQGQSTFMVEMNELANILHNATNQSLIILDEIGRGTSTYDGLSIAWSVVEYLSDPRITGAKTMFATHYHELTELEGKFKGVKNYRISVEEVGDDIVFLRKIVRGSANQSFGIQVAKLAGLPNQVIVRAKEILRQLEEHDINKNINSMIQDVEKPKQLSLFERDFKGEVLDEVNKIDINSLTPLEAMNTLNTLLSIIKEKGETYE